MRVRLHVHKHVQKKKQGNEITDGVIAPVPEPAEERRVRSRHGSPRGVCAAVAWA